MSARPLGEAEHRVVFQGFLFTFPVKAEAISSFCQETIYMRSVPKDKHQGYVYVQWVCMQANASMSMFVGGLEMIRVEWVFV